MRPLTIVSRMIAAALAMCLPAAAQSPRGAEAVQEEGTTASVQDFNPRQSAALFVGIRHFTDDSQLAEVRYAVDDAVDLAFALSLEANSRLVEPGRVALALSGEPKKPESQQRLNALMAAGAVVRPAGHSDVLLLLEQQARTAGKDGALIISLATHGFSEEGTHYLALANSLLQHSETSLRADKVFDIAARSAASRRLIFLDACRERLTATARQTGQDPRSAASPSLIRAITRAQGQVIFFAARAGGYAYDDDRRKNGVFTAAVVDGLRCEAEVDDRGFVTVNALQAFVDQRVKEWIKERRRQHIIDPAANEGIEINLAGQASGMPLASCKKPASPEENPAAARPMDRFFNVFNRSGLRLWGKEVDGLVAQAEVVDLNGDGRNEVIAGVGVGGADTGKILVFGASGEPLWSADTTTRFNYSGGQSGRMTVRTFITADLFRQGTRQILVLSQDSQAWYPSLLSIFDGEGSLLSSYWHPGHLHRIAVGSETPEQEPRIVVAGLNNDLRPAFNSEKSIGCVFLLDPRNVQGEAPPYLGRAGRGSQLWYGLVLPAVQEMERLEILDRNQDGTNDISFLTSTGYVFFLDFQGRVLGSARSDGAQEEWSRFALLEERR